jgi:hypothetical protein
MAQEPHNQHQEQERQRHEQQQAAPRQPSASEKAAADKQAAAARETQAFGSIGAQVILDFNGDGSLGARGGHSATIEENTAARDAHYIALGLNPASVSGPPPSMEVRKARQAATEAQAKANEQIVAAHAEPGAGAASRVSSLAAGLITEPADVPIQPPPPQAEGGAQAAHK